MKQQVSGVKPVGSEPVIGYTPKTPSQTGGTGTGSGNGSGSGSGSESGSGSGGTTVPQPTGPTKRVNLLSAPKADYTDFARIYHIEGLVPVRVTFLPNGEIGTVRAVKELPFGLTQEALKAAKAVKFEPAVRNGVPIAVTMVIEYSFTIY